MPRKTLTVVNPHDKKTEKYEGVTLEEILRKAGVPQGEALATPGNDDICAGRSRRRLSRGFRRWRLGFGIAESEVIVADTMDGAPLGHKLGPFRLVAPHEKTARTLGAHGEVPHCRPRHSSVENRLRSIPIEGDNFLGNACIADQEWRFIGATPSSFRTRSRRPEILSG